MKLLKPAKKSLGQNFLIDKNIINKIINIPKIEKKDTIMEIGPGYGSLTEKIIKENPKKIYAIEKDKKIYFFLKKKLYIVEINIALLNSYLQLKFHKIEVFEINTNYITFKPLLNTK